MKPEEVEPVESQGLLHSSDRESKKYDHPAFGMIGAHRVTGGTTLFGSDFIHHNFITISVKKAQLNRDLSRDWYFARDEIVEVWLSEAQWASFVSSLNHGDGVPCTLSHVRGEGQLPSIPVRRTKDVFTEELRGTTKEISDELSSALAEIEAELGTSISQKKKDKILARLKRADRLINDHLPFAAKSFEKQMENTVEKAKIEVNAYAESVIHRTGLAALKGEPLPLQLGSGDRPEMSDDQKAELSHHGKMMDGTP